MRWSMSRAISIATLVMATGPALSPATARAQYIYVTNYGNGTIGEYTRTGGTVNVALVSGLSSPYGIAVYGSDLFVANEGNGTIGEYTISGGTVNASLISGLTSPVAVAVSGSDLFVVSAGTITGAGTIGEYTTSGGTVNASLISGLTYPGAIALSGSNLFVSSYYNGTIGKYTTSGGTVNASIIAGVLPVGIAVSGSDLFVANGSPGDTVGEYTTSGGSVNASLITGLGWGGIAVSGPDLFVTDGYQTIHEYTTSGSVINNTLVTGLNEPYGMAVTGLVNGIWTKGSGGNWSGSGNWSGGNVPGIFGYPADTATFSATATSGTSVTVTLDTSPQLATMTFSSTSGYVLEASGTNVLTLSAVGGPALVTVSAGGPTIATPLILAGSTSFAPASGTQLTLSGPISGAGGLALTDSGTLILSGTNSYTGGTTISAGTLQATINSLQGSITNNATLVFNQATSGTYAGTINGTGTVGKSGSAAMTFTSPNVTSGPIAVNQGTLLLPNGLAAGGVLTVSNGAALQATGLIGRALTGAGTVTATGDLIVGNSQQAGQFNQGGAPGVGGTLNIGSNAFAVFSSSTAILGSQTNIGPGGSLTALNGAQLGNPSSVDSTKVLTATGSATINANFVNNGIVNGPTGSGQELVFTQAVTGAGSTTGNVEYAASYRPSNSPDAVSVQNVLLEPTSTLIMELDYDTPGSGYDQLDISGLATLNGTLDVSYLNGFSPTYGESFQLFDGHTTGSFSELNLPALGNGLQWYTGNLYSTGTISVVPEPSTLALLAAGTIGLLGYGWRRKPSGARLG
jgi:autotransporter-associated beta strand protein